MLQGRKVATKRAARVGGGRRGKRKRRQVEEEEEEREEDESMMMEESVVGEGGEEVKKLLRQLIKVSKRTSSVSLSARIYAYTCNCLSPDQKFYIVYKIFMSAHVPYFFDQTPWLLFFAVCFVRLLFEGGVYFFGKPTCRQWVDKVHTSKTVTTTRHCQ